MTYPAALKNRLRAFKQKVFPSQILQDQITQLQVQLGQTRAELQEIKAELLSLQSQRQESLAPQPPAPPPEHNFTWSEHYFAHMPADLKQIKYFRAEQFPNSGPVPWLDRHDAETQIEAKLAQGILTPAQAEACRKWVRDGYIIIKNLINHEFLDQVWLAYENAIASGKLTPPPEKASPEDPYPGRIINTHKDVPAINQLLCHPAILEWIAILMEREPRPFQTLISFKGSQQQTHSDSIHMTTYPLGYLTAAWVALEDIHPDSGPLVYYPGTHKLPYIFSQDVGIAPDSFLKTGYSSFMEKYEPAIQKLVQEKNFTPAYFNAQKGDVLIWHANLLHGGSLRHNLQLSRKALVSHYFVKGAVCYHDLSAVIAHF